ncbi:MAG TPA: glycosyltransferase [Gammaproteobacteria bacterium]|nr:glycosyltransferase [Gammaproteobacteria bacterium]
MNGLLFIIGLALMLATLPGVIELALVTFPALLARRHLPASGGGAAVKLAIVTPAHNEASGIGDTIASLLACDHPLPASDIHVVADNCTDRTAEIAAEAGCTVLERHDEQRRGKGYALNFAFSQLLDGGYDALVVVDADTRVDANFLDALRARFGKGASAVQTAYRVGNPEMGRRPRLMHIAFLAFNYLRPLSRQQAGFSCGILGNGFALSSATLAEIPYDSFSIVEDLEYHIRLVRSGRIVEFEPDASVWSDMPVTAEEARSQRERWEGGRFRMVLDQTPKLLRDIFVRRRPALIEPLLELLLLPLSYHVGALLMLLLVAWLAGSGGLMIYGVFALLLIVSHIVIALILGRATLDDWKALFSAPFYMLWKLGKLPAILKFAGKGAEWKRTSRGE